MVNVPSAQIIFIKSFRIKPLCTPENPLKKYIRQRYEAKANKILEDLLSEKERLESERKVIMNQKKYNQQNDEEIASKMQKLYLRLNRANEKIYKLEMLKSEKR